MAKEHKLKFTGAEVEARLEKVTEIDKGKMERPTTGKKGQIVTVKNVDEKGRPIEFEAKDIEIDTFGYYDKETVDKKIEKIDKDIVAANGKIPEHNASAEAHTDIRKLISDLTSRLNAVADSDDTTLDQLSEIVEYIKTNKSLIDSITTSKVSVSDIVDNLTTTEANKPLSAKQGNTLQKKIESEITERNNEDIRLKQHVSNNYFKKTDLIDRIGTGADDRPIAASVVDSLQEQFLEIGQVPKKLSQLENDTEFITAEDIPTKVSELVNDSGYLNANHNASAEAHIDIRKLISDLTSRLNAVADSDDTTLDQLSEIVEYIKSNKSLIDSITTSKVSVSDIIDNLTTNEANKPLSAKQGVKLKSLIESIMVPTALSGLEQDADHRTVSDLEKQKWNSKSDFDGNYESLTGKPTIPKKISQLENDLSLTNNTVVNKIIDEREFLNEEKVNELITNKGLTNRDAVNEMIAESKKTEYIKIMVEYNPTALKIGMAKVTIERENFDGLFDKTEDELRKCLLIGFDDSDCFYAVDAVYFRDETGFAKGKSLAVTGGPVDVKICKGSGYDTFATAAYRRDYPHEKIEPVEKTNEMTQPVGISASGELFTAPSGGSGVSSWNDLIDRPFYSEYTETEIMSADMVEFESSDGIYLADISSQIVLSNLKEGDLLYITLDGVLYKAEILLLTETDEWDEFGAGNLSLADSSFPNTGEPVLIVMAQLPDGTVGQCVAGTTLTGATHSVKISYLQEKVVKKLSDRYLESAAEQVVFTFTGAITDNPTSGGISCNFTPAELQRMTYTQLMNACIYCPEDTSSSSGIHDSTIGRLTSTYSKITGIEKYENGLRFYIVLSTFGMRICVRVPFDDSKPMEIWWVND